ncbi:hypothetical protein JCM6882_000325 [Rhodosporidiobolus microsporus]
MASSPPKRQYTAEISSMVYVFTGIRDPDEDLVNYLEDVTKTTVSEMVIQARAQATRRGSRFLSVEDLVFLVRHDRAKVNRLRSYLSWKDVRKKRVMEPEADEELDGMEEPVSDKALKVVKTAVRLPWELADQWADYLRGEDEPEDDEAEAYEVNKRRLKEAEEITRNMSKEEYEQYAQARQASFVYRKGKKFRDFLSLPTLLDVLSPTDEVLDVLGFLCYECVRALCDAGVTTKRSVAEGVERVKAKEKEREKKRKREEEGAEDADEGAAEGSPGKEGASPGKADPGSPSKKTARKSGEGTSAAAAAAEEEKRSPPSKPLEMPTSLFSAPLEVVPTPSLPQPGAFGPGIGAAVADGSVAGEGALLLKLDDVAQGYQAVQHTQAALKTSGMRNWRGGLSRMSSRLV